MAPDSFFIKLFLRLGKHFWREMEDERCVHLLAKRAMFTLKCVETEIFLSGDPLTGSME